MVEFFTIFICVVFSLAGVWLIISGEMSGWLILLFFGLLGFIVLFLKWRERKLPAPLSDEELSRLSQQQAETDELQKMALANEIEVSDNPVVVWKSILVEEGADWVVFENGTLVVCEEDKDPKESALEIIDAFTETTPGTSLGDYQVVIRPELGIWIVSYPGQRVFNYIELGGCHSVTAAGMLSRVNRENDANGKVIIYTHIVDWMAHDNAV